MTRSRWGLAVAALAAGSLLLVGCGGGSAERATSVTESMLPMPVVDDSDGLVIGGERVADANLLAAARAGSVVWFTGSGSESAELTAARFQAETGVPVQMTQIGRAHV